MTLISMAAPVTKSVTQSVRDPDVWTQEWPGEYRNRNRKKSGEKEDDNIFFSDMKLTIFV